MDTEVLTINAELMCSISSEQNICIATDSRASKEILPW